MSLLNNGLAISFPTIIIPALTGLNSQHNPDEHLTITAEQASWIAAIYSLTFMFGSLLSSFLDPLGRKKSIILGNVPFLIGWLCLYYSNSLWTIYISLAILGATGGCLESPIICYVSEVVEPSIRTILLATTSFTVEFGIASVYFLGNQMPWRDAALVCAAVPIVAALIMLIVPETPQWLLSRDRSADALKSLQWFRGCTEPIDVQVEFENLKRYKTVAYVCYECEKQGTECNHSEPKLLERLREFGRRKNMIPFVIVLCVFLNAIFAGAVFRPYLVPILTYFKSPIDPNTVLVWVGYAGLATNILSMVILRLFGKRTIYLVSLGSAILTIYAIGAHGFLLSNQADGSLLKYLPIVGIILMLFFFNLGLRPVPNLLISEVFSYRSKSLLSGVTLAINYVTYSIATKTFYILQDALTLPGQCIFYASIGVLGFVIAYLLLPETEGCSLEDIEMYFSDKKRKFYNIYIAKMEKNPKKITD